MPRPGSSPAGQWLEPAEAGQRAWTGRVAARDSHGHYSVALSAQPGRLPLHVSPVRARPGNGLRCRQRHSNVCRSCLASDQNIPHACHLKMLLCSRAVAASLGSGLQLRRRPKCAAVNSGSSNHRHMDGLLEIRTWLTRGSQETPAIATVRFKPPQPSKP